ncbi:MAG: hypothetical protein IPL26_00650 [Leptospiraceae bacterium]|nr:hypothetical protein [Leptospiraceae bacterium]
MLNKLLSAILILFLLIPIVSQEIDIENPILTWEAIPNANGYQLQIRNESEEIIVEKKTTESSYTLNLPPGKYSHRVGSYNKFGKISSYSEWFSFNITKTLEPEVTNPKQVIGSKTELEMKILIEGKNFYKDTLISLKNEIESVAIIKTKLKKNGYELTIDNENTKIGNYDLTLENPRKKILVIKDFYILKSEPVISVIPDKPDENVDKDKVADNDKKETESKVETLTYPYWGEAARSALFPGWGQFRKDQKYSGFFFGFSTIVSAAYFYSNYSSFQTAQKDYNQSVTQSLLFQTLGGGEFVTFYGFFSSEEKLQKAQSASASVFNASIILASIYSLNVLDALLWKISNKPPEQTSFHFFTNFQIQPLANSNYITNPQNNSSRIEFGLQFKF